MTNISAEFDLVAIGGGFAGLCAALRGAELGLRTAVVEKGEDERYPCSSRWAGGIFHVSYHDIRLSPARISMATMPCPGAGIHADIGSGTVMRSR